MNRQSTGCLGSPGPIRIIAETALAAINDVGVLDLAYAVIGGHVSVGGQAGLLVADSTFRDHGIVKSAHIDRAACVQIERSHFEGVDLFVAGRPSFSETRHSRTAPRFRGPATRSSTT